MFSTLIVEDNEAFHHLLHEILSSHFPFMLITETENAKSAIDQSRILVPDLVLMDINLPDGNGLSLTRMIKTERDDAIIFVITANDLPEYSHAALLAGASHFIPKGSLYGDDHLDVVESIVTPRINTIASASTNLSLMS